jgi:hypothetical protein
MSKVGSVRRTEVIYRRVSAPDAREVPALPLAFTDDWLGDLALSARLIAVHPAAQQSAPSLLRISEELRARLAGRKTRHKGGRRGKARKR